jgi:hypothetical protein
MGNRITDARNGIQKKDITQGYVPEQMQSASESVVAQPQQTETPKETPVVENPGLGAMARYKSGQTSEAMPQSTNTTSETQSTTDSNDAYNDYLRRKSRGYVDNTLTPETVEETETPEETPVGTPVEEKSGVDYLDSLYEELKPISKEEEERRLRGAASANTVAHLGNLLGALGGLYYTTKGAPAQKIADIKNPDYDAFSERVRKQREAHAGRLRDFDKWKQQMRIDEEELALKKEDAALKREAQELDRQYKQGLISKNELERRILALQEKFAPEKHEAELGRINAQTGSYNSAAYASKKRGDFYANGGSRGDDKIPVWDKDGNQHYFDDLDAAEAFGLANGTWRYDEYDEVSTTETPTRIGVETSTRTTQKRGKGYSVNPKENGAESMLPGQKKKPNMLK